ncbi:hypothetical protein DICPUDRAFT_156893 [Dictyostelium purpureum]|uniref:Uncharacterized protein n=1 Tax=Dictyostelium purpureum TaxID=5786 RepID=F0ZXQ1_DICPU|nr:uncharacterized protein DICPUDRAFT_156893 [Dictyostelium purpureum]EGC31280.1 hypothetical protein DICPUDRAFT_156893 [Dictyostelium purpureum]|eukprot:XP_003292189.1 hypothetical protein DICPUDRAFT_156893 [Dictyostelium purpureum]
MQNLKLLKTHKLDRKKINERSFGIKDKKVIDELVDVTTDQQGFIEPVMKFLSEFNCIPKNYLENRMLCETAHALYSQKESNPQISEVIQKYFLKAASNGSAEGLFFYASIKYLGDNCEQNLPMSRKLFEKGADMDIYVKCPDGELIENKNVIDCCKCLSGFAMEGVGGAVDLECSFKYYSKVLDNNPKDLDALHGLGKLQIELKKNMDEALKLFKKGMELGSADCTFAYAENTFDSNPKLSMNLIERAAKNDCEEAKFRLDEFKDKFNSLNKK